MKKVAFLLPVMAGGGAERVASLLANEFHKSGVDVRFILSHAKADEVIRTDLSGEIPLILLSEVLGVPGVFEKIKYTALGAISSLFCKQIEGIKKPVPASFAKLSITSQYSREIKFVRGLLKADPDLAVIAFLQPTIPSGLLAARGLPNRVIISERSDPNRLMKKRYGRKFIEKYYTRADAVVFQTEGAKNAYPACIAVKGTVIPNPIKPGLPKPYHGARDNNVTTFCRMSKVKNLPILVDAFAMLHRDHPDFKLRIIGDSNDAEGDEVVSTLKTIIRALGLEDAVVFEPFMKNVHEAIIKDAMYVNSSDYEGISNAMLEAMAIGMPVVCTDCPIGGARATITDGENGLLVPVGDAAALYRAMKRVVEDEALSQSLSQNAAHLREELSLDRIAERWINVLGVTDD